MELTVTAVLIGTYTSIPFTSLTNLLYVKNNLQVFERRMMVVDFVSGSLAISISMKTL